MIGVASRRRAVAQVRSLIRSTGSGVAAGASGVAAGYTDPGRKRALVQNPAGSATTLNIGRGTSGSLNAPGSYPAVVLPGQQWRDEDPTTVGLPFWVKDSAGGTALFTVQVDTVAA